MKLFASARADAAKDSIEDGEEPSCWVLKFGWVGSRDGARFRSLISGPRPEDESVVVMVLTGGCQIRGEWKKVEEVGEGIARKLSDQLNGRYTTLLTS